MNAPVLRRAGCPVGVDPHRWRAVLAGRAEWHMTVADRLVAALDRMDGDPDLEPSLAAPETPMPPSWGHGHMPGASQERWAAGGTGDIEQADGDDETSMGWPTPDQDRKPPLGWVYSPRTGVGIDNDA